MKKKMMDEYDLCKNWSKFNDGITVVDQYRWKTHHLPNTGNEKPLSSKTTCELDQLWSILYQ